MSLSEFLATPEALMALGLCNNLVLLITAIRAEAKLKRRPLRRPAIRHQDPDKVAREPSDGGKTP